MPAAAVAEENVDSSPESAFGPMRVQSSFLAVQPLPAEQVAIPVPMVVEEAAPTDR